MILHLSSNSKTKWLTQDLGCILVFLSFTTDNFACVYSARKLVLFHFNFWLSFQRLWLTLFYEDISFILSSTNMVQILILHGIYLVLISNMVSIPMMAIEILKMACFNTWDVGSDQFFICWKIWTWYLHRFGDVAFWWILNMAAAPRYSSP